MKAGWGSISSRRLDEMIGAKAVAERLGVSPRAVYQLHATGALRGYRFGRAVRFSETDVTEYIAACLVVVEPPPEPVRYWPQPKPKPPTARQQAKIEAERVINRAALVRHHSAKRRAEKSSRTPPWADLAKIRALHDEAQRLTLSTGIAHHVDHVLPLQGELVSGLHVETNMQIITGAENSRKKNHFEPC